MKNGKHVGQHVQASKVSRTRSSADGLCQCLTRLGKSVGEHFSFHWIFLVGNNSQLEFHWQVWLAPPDIHITLTKCFDFPAASTPGSLPLRFYHSLRDNALFILVILTTSTEYWVFAHRCCDIFSSSKVLSQTHRLILWIIGVQQHCLFCRKIMYFLWQACIFCRCRVEGLQSSQLSGTCINSWGISLESRGRIGSLTSLRTAQRGCSARADRSRRRYERFILLVGLVGLYALHWNLQVLIVFWCFL